MNFLLKGIFAGVLMFCSVNAALLHVYDSTIQSGNTISWSTGDTILLHGKVFVDSSASLTIGPGVIVKGIFSESDPAALIICKNAVINANGTKEKPIIFTSEYDTDMRSFNSRIKRYTFGLWGGIVILGNAKIRKYSGENNSTFLPYPYGGIEPRASYGGSNDADSSGSLKYISIRYAGSDPIVGVDNEFLDHEDDPREYGGLTLCGVGSRTNISYIEVYDCKADGIKIQGGSVNIKYCEVSSVRDNCIDISEGYHGMCQYILAFFDFMSTPDYVFDNGQQNSNNTAIYHSDPVTTGDPVPVFSNISIFGNGANGTGVPKPFLFDRNSSGAKYYNCLVYGLGLISTTTEVSISALINSGNLQIANSVFNNSIDNKWSRFFESVQLQTFASNDTNFNVIDSFGVNILGYTDAIPRKIWQMKPNGNVVTENIYDVSKINPFFSTPKFKGAFSPYDSMWLTGWNALSLAYLVQDSVRKEPVSPIDTIRFVTVSSDTVNNIAVTTDTVHSKIVNFDTLHVSRVVYDTVRIDTQTTPTTIIDTIFADTIKTDSITIDTIFVDTIKTRAVKIDTIHTDSMRLFYRIQNTVILDTILNDTLRSVIVSADTIRLVTIQYLDTTYALVINIDTVRSVDTVVTTEKPVHVNPVFIPRDAIWELSINKVGNLKRVIPIKPERVEDIKIQLFDLKGRYFNISLARTGSSLVLQLPSGFIRNGFYIFKITDGKSVIKIPLHISM